MIASRFGQLLVLTIGLLGAIAAARAESVDDAVRRCLELLRLGETVAARACFAPKTIPLNGDEVLGQAHEALQIGDPPEYRIVNRAVAYTAKDGRTDTLVVHVRGDATALLVLAQTREINAVPALVGLRWDPAPLDLSERYPFELSGLPLFYYCVLAFAVATPIFMLYAAVVCFRRRPPRRWLWLLFNLLGVGKLSLVWVPGPLAGRNVQLTPLSVQLLGAGIMKTPIYEPWVLSVSFPLGAALFLSSHRGRRPGTEGKADRQAAGGSAQPSSSDVP